MLALQDPHRHTVLEQCEVGSVGTGEHLTATAGVHDGALFRIRESTHHSVRYAVQFHWSVVLCLYPEGRAIELLLIDLGALRGGLASQVGMHDMNEPFTR